jgi:N-acetylated-alpha-linked acidic dipeptidase
MGVPSTDIGSGGPYGVYHSVFDNYNWFIKFADPTFVYEQQQARVFGLEIIHMADADILPYDYRLYAKEITGYIKTAEQKAEADKLNLDFTAVEKAAARFSAAGEAVYGHQLAAPPNPSTLNAALRDAETGLLDPAGLPRRSWYKHTIYAPGEFTGYAAVVIPGVTEAVDQPDATRAHEQLARLADALNRAAGTLEAAK